MLLTSPPSYLTAAQWRAFPNDYDLSGYTDAQLQLVLDEATGDADAFMRKSYLPREQTIRYEGDGSNRVMLMQAPILYVKRVAIVYPGARGFALPLNELLIDFEAGSLYEYTMLYWQGAVNRPFFPDRLPIDVTLAWGCGYNAAKAPAWTAADIQGGGLLAGTYNVAVTAKTFYGETTAIVQTYNTETGSFSVTFPSGLGVYVYRAYLSDATHNTLLAASANVGDESIATTAITGITAGSQWLLGSGATAEVVTITGAPSNGTVPVSALVKAHGAAETFIPVPLLVAESPFTAFGATSYGINVNSLVPSNELYQDTFPTEDSSAPAVPPGILKGTRLIALAMLYEQKNVANQGIAVLTEGTIKTYWRSTEGNSGKGIPLMVSQARDALAPYSLQSIY